MRELLRRQGRGRSAPHCLSCAGTLLQAWQWCSAAGLSVRNPALSAHNPYPPSLLPIFLLPLLPT